VSPQAFYSRRMFDPLEQIWYNSEIYFFVTTTKMPATTLTKKKKTTKKTLSFGERTEQRVSEENQWQQYNAEAPFHAAEIQKSLEILAGKTFPTDTENRSAYQEAILKSLTETLSPEVGVKDFWAKMAEAQCETLKIESGHLNFYDKKGKHIDITPYTQAIIFEAHSSYYDQRNIERQERIEEAKKQLMELVKEINTRR